MSDLPPIIVDTREKKPYSFYGQRVIRTKLDTGDYSLKGFKDEFAVERKSLDDYLRSITHDRDRFEREVQRGSNDLSNFRVVIEADDSEVRKGNYRRDVPPMAAINTAKAWNRPDRYNVPFIWAGNRTKAKALTLDYLKDWFAERDSF